MNRRNVLAVVVALATVAVALPAAAQQVTVTGEVIDSACFIKMGATGEGHRECAQACGDAGIPLALLDEANEEVVWLAAKEDMKSPNADLREYAGRKVTITGEYKERGGARILVIDTIRPAN